MHVARRVKLAVLAAAALAAVIAVVAARREASTTGLPLYSGTVEAREVVLASQEGGRLVTVAVEEGQRVAAGELLFTLDDADLRLEVAALEARRATALAEVAALEAGPRRPAVRGQRSRVKEARVAVAQAARDVERASALREHNAGTPAEVDAAVLALRSLEQRLETERQQMALVEAGAPEPEIAVGKRRADELEPALQRARLRLSRARVVAPFAGVITRRIAEPGELVPAGGPVVALLDRDHLWVELNVDARAHARLQAGEDVVVRAEADAALAPFAGRVSYVGDRHAFSPRGAETRDDRALLSYRVKVTLPGPPPAVKPGMFVTVEARAP